MKYKITAKAMITGRNPGDQNNQKFLSIPDKILEDPDEYTRTAEIAIQFNDLVDLVLADTQGNVRRISDCINRLNENRYTVQHHFFNNDTAPKRAVYDIRCTKI